MLVKIGLESKDHATTTAVLEYFFGEQISKNLIEKFNELKQTKDKIEAITIDEKYIGYLWKIKRARETVQYGISISYRETDIIMKNAREFVNKIKLVITELDDNLIELLTRKINELKEKVSEDHKQKTNKLKTQAIMPIFVMKRNLFAAFSAIVIRIFIMV